MSSKDPLLDGLVATSRETTVVTLSTDLEVPVRGLTILEVCRVVTRFLAFKKQLLSYLGVGFDDSSGLGSILVDAAPDLVGAVLAVAAGRPNDREIEVLFGSLGDVDTLALLGAVKTARMPEGPRRFFRPAAPDGDPDESHDAGAGGGTDREDDEGLRGGGIGPGCLAGDDLVELVVRLRARNVADAAEMAPGMAVFAWLTLVGDDRDRRLTNIDADAARWGSNAKPDEFDWLRKDLRR